MAASRSPASRRDRGRHADNGPGWLVSAATRQEAQEADAGMAREYSRPDYPAPARFYPPALAASERYIELKVEG